MASGNDGGGVGVIALVTVGGILLFTVPQMVITILVIIVVVAVVAKALGG
jgi:hypothetical protein